jgi:hypothetical protein
MDYNYDSAHVYFNEQDLSELIRSAKQGNCRKEIIDYLQSAGDERFWRH